MDSVTLSTLSGSVLSLAFSYAPGLSGWYASLGPQRKALVMLLIMVATTIGVFVASCSGLYVTVACSSDGAVELAKMFFAALVANQGTYGITRKL